MMFLFFLVYLGALPRDIRSAENASVVILKGKAKGTEIVVLVIPSDVWYPSDKKALFFKWNPASGPKCTRLLQIHQYPICHIISFHFFPLWLLPWGSNQQYHKAREACGWFHTWAVYPISLHKYNDLHKSPSSDTILWGIELQSLRRNKII